MTDHDRTLLRNLIPLLTTGLVVACADADPRSATRSSSDAGRAIRDASRSESPPSITGSPDVPTEGAPPAPAVPGSTALDAACCADAGGPPSASLDAGAPVRPALPSRDAGHPPAVVDASAAARDAGTLSIDAAAFYDAGLRDAAVDAAPADPEKDAGPPPLLVDLALEEPARAPLARRLRLQTRIPTTVSVRITLDGVLHWERAFEGEFTEHTLPLLGFHPARTYEVHVTLAAADGSLSTLPPATFTTAPLPADWPPIRVLESRPNEMEPGLTLFGVRARDGSRPYTVALDAAGEPHWYTERSTAELRQLPDGTILAMGNGQLFVMDMFGEIVRAWHGSTAEDPEIGSVFVDVPLLHHEIFPMSNGNFLSLSRIERTVEDYPVRYDLTMVATTTITDDLVVEFEPDDGAVVHQWSLGDITDLRRVGYDSLGNGPMGEDWAHSNAVIHDEASDAYIVSMRHQDAVVKIARETGALLWILGNHQNWPPEFAPYLLTPVGEPFAWPYHQHAPMLTSEGTVVLFDNGNHRVSPPETPVPDDQNYSRAVEFSIDEELKTVEQVWEYGENADERVYSGSIGDANRLPTTDNVLIVFGHVSFVDGVKLDSNDANNDGVRILEVSHESPARKLFELRVEDDVNDAGGWTTARATRIPGLYPHQ